MSWLLSYLAWIPFVIMILVIVSRAFPERPPAWVRWISVVMKKSEKKSDPTEKEGHGLWRNLVTALLFALACTFLIFFWTDVQEGWVKAVAWMKIHPTESWIIAAVVALMIVVVYLRNRKPKKKPAKDTHGDSKGGHETKHAGGGHDHHTDWGAVVAIIAVLATFVCVVGFVVLFAIQKPQADREAARIRVEENEAARVKDLHRCGRGNARACECQGPTVETIIIGPNEIVALMIKSGYGTDFLPEPSPTTFRIYNETQREWRERNDPNFEVEGVAYIQNRSGSEFRLFCSYIVPSR